MDMKCSIILSYSLCYRKLVFPYFCVHTQPQRIYNIVPRMGYDIFFSFKTYIMKNLACFSLWIKTCLLVYRNGFIEIGKVKTIEYIKLNNS